MDFCFKTELKSVLENNDEALEPFPKKTEHFSGVKNFNISGRDKTHFCDNIYSDNQPLRVGFLMKN